MKNNKEINKNILDNFIEKELEIKPNPFLAAKVMARINAQNNELEGMHAGKIEKTTHNVAFKIAMAVSAAAVLALGVFLGSNYISQEQYNSQNSRIALNINDTHLENLYLYNVEE